MNIFVNHFFMRPTFAATNEIIMRLFRTINTFISIQFGQTDITVSSLEFLNFNFPIDVTERNFRQKKTNSNGLNCCEKCWLEIICSNRFNKVISSLEFKKKKQKKKTFIWSEPSSQKMKTLKIESTFIEVWPVVNGWNLLPGGF